MAKQCDGATTAEIKAEKRHGWIIFILVVGVFLGCVIAAARDVVWF